MKAIIESNRLLVNTYDESFKGQPIFGKIIEINLRARMAYHCDSQEEFEHYYYERGIGTIPAYCEKSISYWNAMAQSNDFYRIVDLISSDDYYKMILEINQALSALINAQMSHLQYNNELFEVEVSYFNTDGLVK